MITVNGKTFRNLEEQVQYLTKIIGKTTDIIKQVVGQVDKAADLPDAAGYKIGDTFIVGTQAPFEYYVNVNGDSFDGWVSLGTMPLEGPEGKDGKDGYGVYKYQAETTQYINQIDKQYIYNPSNIPVKVGCMIISENAQYFLIIAEEETTYTVRYLTSIGKGDKGDRGPRGEQGEQGEQGVQGLQGVPGRGIVNIQKTSTVGQVDTYTIYYNDETTSTFEVRNGEDVTAEKIIEALGFTPASEDSVLANKAAIDKNTVNIKEIRDVTENVLWEDVESYEETYIYKPVDGAKSVAINKYGGHSTTDGVRIINQGIDKIQIAHNAQYKATLPEEEYVTFDIDSTKTYKLSFFVDSMPTSDEWVISLRYLNAGRRNITANQLKDYVGKYYEYTVNDYDGIRFTNELDYSVSQVSIIDMSDIETVATIPNSLKNLPNYGAGIQEQSNEVDIINNTYTDKIASIGFDELTWNKTQQGSYYLFYAQMPANAHFALKTPMLCEYKYTKVAGIHLIPDKSCWNWVFAFHSRNIVIRDDSLSYMTGEEFKNFMSGSYIYYISDAPTTYDISESTALFNNKYSVSENDLIIFSQDNEENIDKYNIPVNVLTTKSKELPTGGSKYYKHNVTITSYEVFDGWEGRVINIDLTILSKTSTPAIDVATLGGVLHNGICFSMTGNEQNDFDSNGTEFYTFAYANDYNTYIMLNGFGKRVTFGVDEQTFGIYPTQINNSYEPEDPTAEPEIITTISDTITEF